MTEFCISKSQKEHEINLTKQRNLKLNRIFVLLLGPSATGKSTIIDELRSRNDGLPFEYIKPIMTRLNREGETNKISVSEAEFCRMKKLGRFVVVNNLYGVSYGTPLDSITESLDKGRIPILDYPLATVNLLKRPEYDTLNFYIYPPSINEWKKRMDDTGRNNNDRFQSGLRELDNLTGSNYCHENIDISIVNNTDSIEKVSDEIVQAIQAVTRD